MMDEVLMNPITSHEELQECLEDYDRNWFIGLESDPDWSRAILAGKPHLFSLGHNTSQVCDLLSPMHSKQCQDIKSFVK